MKKVVVIGGGFAGTECAKSLQDQFKVTLIDTKPYFEYTPGILRSIVDLEHIKSVQKLHSHYLKRTDVVIDKVKEVTKSYVKLRDSDKKIPFDYLVIASGSSYTNPIKEEGTITATRASHLRNSHEKLEKANKVLIIGGGLVGVELAAEIIETYPKKEVTICHSRDKLINRNHPKAISAVEKFFEKRNVKVIRGEKVKEFKKKHCVTDKGTKMKTDMVFTTTGIKPNYELMEKNFKDKITERKNILVNDFLQLPGFPNIFVAGDITSIKEEKTAQNAEDHAHVVIHNIKALENKGKLIEHSAKSRPMVISLGKYNGVLQNGNLVMSGLHIAFLKWFIERMVMWKYR